jgi:hypothetical protein
MTRSLPTVFLALALLAAGAAPASADMAGPWPWSKRPSRPLRYGGTEPDPAPTPAPQPPAEEKAAPAPAPNPQPMYPDDRAIRLSPRRSGPFRSCGSGTPACLAGIGLTWGMLWLGNRFAGRVARRKTEGR